MSAKMHHSPAGFRLLSEDIRSMIPKADGNGGFDMETEEEMENRKSQAMARSIGVRTFVAVDDPSSPCSGKLYLRT
jgi:hypothetical protein